MEPQRKQVEATQERAAQVRHHSPVDARQDLPTRRRGEDIADAQDEGDRHHPGQNAQDPVRILEVDMVDEDAGQEGKHIGGQVADSLQYPDHQPRPPGPRLHGGIGPQGLEPPPIPRPRVGVHGLPRPARRFRPAAHG